MKKLFILGSFLTIFIFFSGCQTETPISPNDQDVTLERIKPLEFNGTVQTDGSGFVGVNLDWTAIRGVAYYEVSYYDLYSGKQKTELLSASELAFNVVKTMLQISGKSCAITVSAYKYRKETPVLLASSTQTYTYNGTSINEINISSSSNLSDCNPFTCIDVYWPQDLSVDHYTLAKFPSWDTFATVTYDLGAWMTSWGAMLWYHTLTAGDFATVTLYAHNSSGGIVGIGNYKITYNP